jgi:hypothetical protein
VRIVDAASSLVGRLTGHGLEDEFLSEFRAEWEQRKILMVGEPDNFVSMLDDIAARFVHEAKKRNQVPLQEP